MLLSLLVVAAGTIIYLASHARSAWKSLPRMLSSVVSERVEGKFSVGKVDISPTGLVFHDVRLTADNDGKKPLLDAEQVRVGMRLAQLIRDRKDPIRSVESVEIVRPTAFLERGIDGKWNIAGILKPTEPTKPGFSGRITVRNGKVSVVDRALFGKAHRNAFTNVNAVVDLANPSVAKCILTADGPRGRMAKLSVKAEYDLSRKSFSADIDGLGADASYWTRYPFDLKILDATSGRADFRLHLAREGERKPIRTGGEFLVSDAVVKFGWMRKPVSDLRGTITLKSDEAALSLRGRIESTPLEASGRIIGLRRSTLAIDLRSEHANFRELSGVFGVAVPKGTVLPTTGRAHVSISGPASSPSAVFKVDAPSISYSGYSAKIIHAEGTYSAGRLVIRRATGRAYGGALSAYGEFGWGARKGGSFRGTVSNIRVSQIPAVRRKGIDAASSGHFGLELGASGVAGAYRGTLTGGTYQKYRFDRGVLALSYGGDGVHLDQVSAEILGGKVAASGGVSASGSLDLDVSGAGIDLAAAQEHFWKHPMSGTLQFSGKLKGTADAPSFDGRVEAYGVVMKDNSAERITADMEATRTLVTLRALEIDDPDGRVTVSGEIANPFAVVPTLDLLVSAESIDIEKWVAAAELPVNMSGMLSADLDVTQTLANPRIEGGVRVADGRVADLPLESAHMHVAYHNSRLTLTDFEANSGGGVITADGSLGLDDGALAFTIGAEGVSVAAVADSLKEHVLLSGSLDADIEVSGTVEETALSGSVASSDLRVNGQSFDTFEADMSWSGDRLTVGEALLAFGDTEYTLSELSYLAADRKADLSFEVRDALIENLIALIERGPRTESTSSLRRYAASVPRPAKGVVGASVTGSLLFEDDGITPDLHFQGQVSDARIGLSAISSIKMDGDLEGRSIRLNRLEALDGDTDLVASAVLGPEGEIDVQIDAHGVDLASAAKWAGLDQNFSGSADVTIIAEGTRSAPSVEASFDIQDPMIEGMKFDGLRARLSGAPSGEGRAAGNRIDIEDLTIVLGDSQLRASGYVPVDWKEYTVPRDQDLLVELYVDDDSLKLLSALAGRALVGELGGSIAGKVSYGGTIEAPRLEGGFQWRDGTVQLARLKQPFEQIEADVSLSGDVLSIDRLVGKSAEGGSFRISGPVGLVNPESERAPGSGADSDGFAGRLGLNPRLDLTLVTSSLKVSGKNISGKYGESIEAVFDSSIQATGDWTRPLLTGTIAIPRGVAGMSGAPDEPLPPMLMSFDPRFDISVTTGRGLVLKSARIEAALPGSLSLGGSLKEPVVDGLINLVDGTIVFPMRSFRILPGSDMRIRVSPGQPVLAMLDVKARGRVVDTNPLGKRTRYDVTMEATGPLDKLHPTFTSSPVGLPEQRIIALVTGQYHFEQLLSGGEGQDFGRELSGLFSSALLPTVFSPIEEAFEQALGLDEFALEMGYQEPVQVSIGDQLGANTFISYSAAIGARPDYADSRYKLSLSYRVRDNLEIGIHTDENRELGISAEGKIRF